MDLIPGHLRRAYTGDLGGNNQLRVGEVYERLPPTHDRNRNGFCDEYTVYVQHTDKGVYDPKSYYNCTLLSDFGGLADKSHHALRANEKKSGIEKGSKVLVLCINGDMHNGIIIGGIRDAQETDKDDKDRFGGHYYYWIFNGVEIYINDDGEYTLSYKGKTENDGKRNSNVKESSVGSVFSMLKDGVIKNLAINEWRVEVSNGKAIIKPKNGLEIGDATDKMILGSTYRDAESSLNQDIQTSCANLATKMGTIGGALQIAATTMKVPISGPVAAAPSFDTVGQLLLQAVQDFQKIAQSIAKFEAQANKYLSARNKSD